MYIHVHLTPGAKKELLEDLGDNKFKASVKPKAERNMANSALRALLAKYFKVPINAVRIVNGHRSPSKLIDIAGVLKV